MLVIGERGTGKELIAERLHHLSSRWAGPLVTMNCAALPENLIEAELFGHEAGSFTGAAKTRHGRFEEADGGTLFLDELATLSSPAQDRLLRAVEYGEITRIGASKPIQVDVRIVAATNEHLPRLVDEGRFRADLLDRLSFEVVTLPPLRVAQGRHPVARRAFRAAHGGRARLAQLAGLLDAAHGRARNLSAGPATSANCATSSSARSIATRIPSGRSTHIQFDPFQSPWAPAERARRPRRARSAAPTAASPSAGASAAAARRRRPTTCAARSMPMSERCSRTRLAATASTSAPPPPRSGLSYDQLRHALKRHKLLDAAAG